MGVRWVRSRFIQDKTKLIITFLTLLFFLVFCTISSMGIRGYDWSPLTGIYRYLATFSAWFLIVLFFSSL